MGGGLRGRLNERESEFSNILEGKSSEIEEKERKIGENLKNSGKIE
jgi:hypothetical protein